MPQNTSSTPPRRLVSEANTSAAVSIPAAGNTTFLTVDVSQLARVAFEIKNEGANAFDAFIVQGKVTSGSNWMTLFSAAADFTSPAGLVVDASGDLTVLAAGATGWLVLDCLGFNGIRLQASANVSGATSASAFAGGA